MAHKHFFFLQTFLIIDFFCTYYRLSLLSRIMYHNKRGCNEPQVVLYLAKTHYGSQIFLR